MFGFHRRSTQGNVLCVSRLAPGRGLDTLLTAFGMLADDRPSVDLELVGDGPLDEGLRVRARSLGLEDRLLFRGRLAPAEVQAAMRRCAVLVLPCRVDEYGIGHALPSVLVKAMTFGTPVVTSTVDGVPEVIRHATTGLLVPPGEPAALAVAVDALLDDPARATEIGAAGRRLVARLAERDRATGGLRVRHEVHQ